MDDNISVEVATDEGGFVSPHFIGPTGTRRSLILKPSHDAIHEWLWSEARRIYLLLDSDNDLFCFFFGTGLRYLECLLKTLEISGFGLVVVPNDIDLTFGNKQWNGKGCVKTFKDFTTWPLARFDGDVPKFHCPFRGGPRKYFQQLFQKKSARKLFVAKTIFDFKKISYVVPKAFVQASISDAINNATKPRRAGQDEMFIESVSVKVQYMFRAQEPWKPSEFVKDFSLNSCYESSQKKGGVYGWWFGRTQKGMSLCGDANKCSYQKGMVFPTRQEVFEVIKSYNGIYHRKNVAICEPLKVRTIEATQAAESPFWADYQKHTQRENVRQCRHIMSGLEVTLDRMQRFYTAARLFQSMTGIPTVVVSDDASAATECIHPDLTCAATEWSIPPEYREIYRESWGKLDETARRAGRGAYVHGYLNDEPVVWKRTNGQGMGCRPSFVALCRIHAAVKELFLDRIRVMPEVLENKYVYYLLDYMVNGDDGLIFFPKSMLEEYKVFVSRLWELNMVKTLVSNVGEGCCFSFNSVLYSVKGVTVYEVPSIRWNLIKRVDKLGEEVKDPTVWNLLVGSVAGRIDKLWLWKEFNKNWSATLRSFSERGNNFFLPHIAGGLGLVAPKPYYTTPGQRYVMRETFSCIGTTRKPRWMTWRKTTRGKIVDRDENPVDVSVDLGSTLWEGCEPITVDLRLQMTHTGVPLRLRNQQPGTFKEPTASVKLMTKRIPDRSADPLDRDQVERLNKASFGYIDEDILIATLFKDPLEFQLRSMELWAERALGSLPRESTELPAQE